MMVTLFKIEIFYRQRNKEEYEAMPSAEAFWAVEFLTGYGRWLTVICVELKPETRCIEQISQFLRGWLGSIVGPYWAHHPA